MNPEHRPKVSYEECDALVCRYRDHGDEDAAAGLIQAFEGYIMKYYNLIRWGKVYIHDRNIREFLKLYMKNDFTRRHIHQYQYMSGIQEEIYQTAESVRKLMEPYTKPVKQPNYLDRQYTDELMNEIIVALLTMAKRYKSQDGKPRFHAYILRAFHFQLRRQLQTLVADPIVFRMAYNVNFQEDQYDGDNEQGGGARGYRVENMVDQTVFTIEDSLDSVNDNWVLGLTASEEYRDFTIMERKIIKMYYVDEMTDQQIANELGTCRATVNRRRNKSIGQLETIFARQRRLIT